MARETEKATEKEKGRERVKGMESTMRQWEEKVLEKEMKKVVRLQEERRGLGEKHWHWGWGRREW